MPRTILFPIAALAMLAGCNTGFVDTDVERGLAGAAIGGLGTAALDGNVAAGAAVGAAAGVFCDDLGVCE